MDCKATVKLGDLSRGGMTRGDNRACDHDMGDYGKHTPCGILDEDAGQLHIEFGSSAKTSGFIAGVVEHAPGARAASDHADSDQGGQRS